MSAMAGVEHIDLTEIVESIEIPCEWGDWKTIPRHTGARWVARRVPCVCGFRATRLICDNCKDAALNSEDLGCACAECGDFVVPFRRVIASIEAIDRRPG